MCLPESPVRGSDIDCQVSAATAFEVVEQRARPLNRARDGDTDQIIEDVRATYQPGEVHHWAGALMTETRVTVVVRVSGRKRVLRTDISPVPRAWSSVSLDPPSVTRGFRGEMTDYPSSKVLGNAVETFDNVNSMPIIRATSGPNTGIGVAATLPSLGHSIFLHPGLYPAPPTAGAATWRSDQNGTAAGQATTRPPRCSAAVFATLTPEVERHEGTTMSADSHWGVAAAYFATATFAAEIERMVSSDTSAFGLRQHAYDRFVWHGRAGGALRRQHARFDVSDYRRINRVIGCTIDYEPLDP